MMPTELRDRRRTLRYRHLLVRQMVQMSLMTADGDCRGVQQAAAAQSELFPGTALRERRGSLLSAWQTIHRISKRGLSALVLLRQTNCDPCPIGIRWMRSTNIYSL